ncbi:hypothetical protein AAFC00_007116 [Neodothiora populina]|uniref:Carboxylic ester hydrolase n=1 Tax=Neodothiora populina TaxID=2781224 RepID=A0ABR3PCB6_9PEZI
MKLSTIISALALAPSAFGLSTSPTVKINNGTILGRHLPEYDQDLFLGIPFAQPPTGELRFNLPKAINETWKEPFNATEYGPICLQFPTTPPLGLPQSEDCLSLNIVRPANISSDARLPVLVYLYGGGFHEGGSADGSYNTSFLVKNSVQMRQPVIMVTLNYRLSGFGLLAGEIMKNQGLANIALHDQRMAFQWIQDNIGAFGGDNNKVTIQGESAGAISVGYHLLAYNGRDDGLFQAAICQSGGPWFFAAYTSTEDQDKAFQTLLNATDCTNAVDPVSCLRAAPLDILNATMFKLDFLPIVDGGIIPTYNSVALKRGNFVKVPLLIGSNTDDGSLFAGFGTNTTEEFRAFVKSNGYVKVADNETVDLMVEAYPYIANESMTLPAPYGDQVSRARTYTGDVYFTAGRRFACEQWTDYGVPCYSYRFDTYPLVVDPLLLGVAHFEEVAFVFNNIIGTGRLTSAFETNETSIRQRYEDLSQVMSQMWLSFASTHDPNNHRVKSFSPHWPRYDIEQPQNIVLNATAGSWVENDDYRKEGMRLLVERALSFYR